MQWIWSPRSVQHWRKTWPRPHPNYAQQHGEKSFCNCCVSAQQGKTQLLLALVWQFKTQPTKMFRNLSFTKYIAPGWRRYFGMFILHFQSMLFSYSKKTRLFRMTIIMSFQRIFGFCLNETRFFKDFQLSPCHHIHLVKPPHALPFHDIAWMTAFPSSATL